MLSQLLEKKAHWGFLEGQDALAFLRYVRGSAGETKWTDETFAELTKFCLGLPTKPGFTFQVVAGESIQQVAMSATQQTVLSRFAARKAKNAARQARLRERAIASVNNV